MCRLSYDDRKAKSIVVARKQVYGEDNSNEKISQDGKRRKRFQSQKIIKDNS